MAPRTGSGPRLASRTAPPLDRNKSVRSGRHRSATWHTTRSATRSGRIRRHQETASVRLRLICDTWRHLMCDMIRSGGSTLCIWSSRNYGHLLGARSRDSSDLRSYDRVSLTEDRLTGIIRTSLCRPTVPMDRNHLSSGTAARWVPDLHYQGARSAHLRARRWRLINN